MRPICSYCDKKAPSLVPIAATLEGTIIESCCRKCESEMQIEGYLWHIGSGWTRRQDAEQPGV